MPSAVYGILATACMASSVLGGPYGNIALKSRSFEEPRVLVAPFKRNTVSVAANLQRRAGTHDTIIHNYKRNQYNINITLGTPPQSLGVQLDTGSVDLVIYTKNVPYCKKAYCTGGAFDQKASTSLKVITDGFITSYGDGTKVLGDYASDNLSFGGMNLANQTFGLIETAAIPDGLNQDVWGLMGVGYKLAGGDNTGVPNYPTLMDNLVAQGLIRKKAYSLYLNSQDASTGSILFGGVDTTKYTGNLAALPMQINPESNTIDRFLVTWDSLKVVDSSNSTLYSANNLATAVLLDSGGTNSILPGPIVSDLVRGVGGLEYEGAYFVPCALANISSNFVFGFGAGSGVSINVPVSELVQPLDLTAGNPQLAFANNHQPICQLGITSAASSDSSIVLGDSFLRSAYLVYNLDDYQIGLAQANRNPSETPNIQEITGHNGSVPNAVTTISGKATAVATQVRSQANNPASTITGTGTALNQPSATFGFQYSSLSLKGGAPAMSAMPMAPAALAIAALGAVLM